MVHQRGGGGNLHSSPAGRVVGMVGLAWEIVIGRGRRVQRRGGCNADRKSKASFTRWLFPSEQMPGWTLSSWRWTRDERGSGRKGRAQSIIQEEQRCSMISRLHVNTLHTSIFAEEALNLRLASIIVKVSTENWPHFRTSNSSQTSGDRRREERAAARGKTTTTRTRKP